MKKILSVFRIVFGILAILLAVLMFVLPKEFTTVLAIVMICLSIAGGLILTPLYPIFFITLLFGIMALFLPKTISSLVSLIIGIALLIFSWVAYSKKKHLKKE